MLPSIGASYAVGIDGLSLLLILLTTFLTFIAVLASWATTATADSRGKEYYIAVLLLEAGMLGVYMALDLLLFCLCWVLAAASMCLLIGAVGGRMRAALRVCAIAIVPGLVILLGVLALHVQGRVLTGAATFDLRSFQHLSIPLAVQRWIFLAFFAGFVAGLLGVFRWWLAVAANGRAVAVPLLLAAVFLKMGTYGFLRLSLPLLPDASRAFATVVVGLSAVGSSSARLPPFAQTNWTRVLAFASLSHICLVMLGAFALTPDGLTGSAVHQINHGIPIAALFLVAGLVAERGQAADLSEYGGLLNAMPLIAALWLLMTLSLVGVPKLNGFVGTSLIVEGIWPVNRVGSAVAVTGMVLSGVAVIVAVLTDNARRVEEPDRRPLKDLRLREALVFVPLVLLAVWVGLRPAPLLARVETSVARIVLRVSPQFASEVSDCLSQPVPPPADGLLPGMVLAAPCADGAGSPTPVASGSERDRQPRFSASGGRMIDLLLVLMAVIWGTNYSIVKFAFQEARSAGVQRGADGDRVGGVSGRHRRHATPTCRRPAAPAPPDLASIFRTPTRLTARDALELAGLGLVGHFLYQYFFIGGLALTTVANSSLMLAATPVVIALISAVFGQERIGTRHWAGAALSLLGIYVVVGRGVDLGGRGLTGDLMMVAAVICWAVYTLGSRRLISRHSPVGVTGLSMLIGTLVYVPVMWSHVGPSPGTKSRGAHGSRSSTPRFSRWALPTPSGTPASARSVARGRRSTRT